jgi:hypothetical protein
MHADLLKFPTMLCVRRYRFEEFPYQPARS